MIKKIVLLVQSQEHFSRFEFKIDEKLIKLLIDSANHLEDMSK